MRTRLSLLGIERLLATIVLVTWITATGQQPSPRIAYVYPAGGRPGTSFEITVGGQALAGMSNALLTFPGATFAFLEFNRPMNVNEFNRLRDRLKELQDKRQASRRSRDTTNAFTAADAREITDIQQRIIKNPPNRQGNPSLADKVRLKVSLPPGIPPAQHELRLVGPSGLSNPLVFRIDDLPEFTAPPARPVNPEMTRLLERMGRAPVIETTEHRVSIPVIVNGQVMPGTVDRLRFMARRGQRIVAAVTARGLIPYIPDAVPGWFQAALTLRDSSGREIAYNDDFHCSPDPVLVCEIPRDGEYVLEIKDAIYRGREDFVYRIALGELPYVTGAFPLGAEAGHDLVASLQGWNLGTNTTLRLTLPAPGTQLSQALTEAPIINTIAFAADDLPEIIEDEPRANATNAQPVTLPIIVNGRIKDARDIDRFEFEGRAGQEIVAEIAARRLGSPLDSFLRLLDATGSVLASNDDHTDPASGLNTHHADSWLRFRLPSDGKFTVQVSDAQRHGGEEFAYRLRLSAPRPRFELRVAPSSVNARGGLPIPVSIHALRHDGFQDAIDLDLVDPPAGFALQGARIPAGQDRVRVTLSVPPAPRTEPVELRFRGRATIEGRVVEQVAVPAEDMMQAFAYRHLVPARRLLVFVGGRGFAPNPFRPAVREAVRIPVDGIARFRVSAPPGVLGRRFELELDDPPEGLSLQEVVPLRESVELIVRSDPSKSKPGQAGNLIVNVMPVPGAGGARRPPRPAAVRRLPLGALPALPFEIVAAQR